MQTNIQDGNEPLCSNEISPIPYWKRYRQANKEKINAYQRQYARKAYAADVEKYKQRTKEYANSNAEKVKEYHRQYCESNSQEISEYQKQYRESHMDALKQQSRENYAANREKIIEQNTAYYNENKQKVSETAKRCYAKNIEQRKQKRKEWYEANKDKIIERGEQYKKRRKETDELFRFKCLMRQSVYNAFSRIKQNKHTNTLELLGCTWQQAKEHFESLFQPGMSWSNYGEWHIDHIKPVASFTEETLHEMNHISNLQPLWALDNLSKSDN